MKKTIVPEGDLGDWRERLAAAHADYVQEFGLQPKFCVVSREDTDAILRQDISWWLNHIGRPDAEQIMARILREGVSALRDILPEIMGTRAVWDIPGDTAFTNAVELNNDGEMPEFATRRILTLYFSPDKTHTEHAPLVSELCNLVVGYIRIEESFGADLTDALHHARPLPGETVLNTVFARNDGA